MCLGNRPLYIGRRSVENFRQIFDLLKEFRSLTESCQQQEDDVGSNNAIIWNVPVIAKERF